MHIVVITADGYVLAKEKVIMRHRDALGSQETSLDTDRARGGLAEVCCICISLLVTQCVVFRRVVKFLACKVSSRPLPTSLNVLIWSSMKHLQLQIDSDVGQLGFKVCSLVVAIIVLAV